MIIEHLIAAVSSDEEFIAVKRLLAIALIALLGLPAGVPWYQAYASRQTLAGRPFSESVQDYPRIASVYAVNSPDRAATFARYGMIIAARTADSVSIVRAIKTASPSARVFFYDNTSTVDIPSFDGMHIFPGWWLTLAGTQLAAAISAATTTIPVRHAVVIQRFLATNSDVLVGGESMHVLTVNTANNTLTVQRGYYSSPSPHPAGARLAAHATKWPQSWMLNITPFCPVDPATGLTWMEYAAQRARLYLTDAPWDGVLWDDGNVSFAHLFDGQIDADNNNVADGGDGPSHTAWVDGVKRLLALTHSLAPGKLQLITDAYYPGLMDGQQMEHFPYYSDGWTSGFSTYLLMAGPSKAAPYSIIAADTSNTGIQDLRYMRFNLATTLMGDGYYSYDFGPEFHGQTWWYDEYDQGAGSSLAAAIDAVQTALTLVRGTGGRFHVGDVVRVPDDAPRANAPGGADDEQMAVMAVDGDTLIVRRGYNGTTATTHAFRTKVMTQAQIMAGLGWLGQPLGPAVARTLSTPSQVVNADFERAPSTWLTPWSLQVNPPAVVSISQDTHTFAGGWASAKIVVSTASPRSSWDAALIQQDTPALHLKAGSAYTLSFWAKGSAGQTLGAGVQQSRPPWIGRIYQEYTLTSRWERYAMTFTAPVTEAAIKLQFNLAQSVGTIWLDRVRFQAGDPNLWRRDFEHGTVLLNATSTSQTVTLGAGYRRIAGTQDRTINSGADAASVTIAPHDAILLARRR